MARPREIRGTPGSRIRVLLGQGGEDYLYFLDEDTGDREFQTVNWTATEGGLPSGLASQLNNLPAKGRHMTQVSFGPEGEWYVHGVKRDGSGGFAWWGGTSATDSIFVDPRTSHSLQVAFGHDNRWALIQGGNGSWFSHGINEHLVKRVESVRNRKRAVHFLRLFADDGYFISDSEGTEWVGVGIHCAEELKKSGGGEVRDVAVAQDGSWVVIRDHRFAASEGVSNELSRRLAEFYSSHRARQAAQKAAIAAYDQRVEAERVAHETALRLAEEVRRLAEESRCAEEKRERAAVEERRLAVERSLKRRSEMDISETIASKKLRHGMQVTVVGRSYDLGDAFVVSTGSEGVSIQTAEGSIFSTSDLMGLTEIVPYDERDEAEAAEELRLVHMASDEYEAAISIYHCVCTQHGCVCVRTARAFTSRIPITERARPVEIPGWVSGQPFDEYRCAEKLDRRRLLGVIQDLRTDEAERNARLNNLEARLQRQTSPQLVEQVRKLKRCQVLGLLAEALGELTQELVEDSQGHVVHEVMYEQNKPSFRGRLFAKGATIRVTDDKYPRTATLQSMHKELRNALVGSFAYDVDCENSEYRLICSLASQLSLEHLVPTIMSYRDQRESHLDMICRQHLVSIEDAKRLPNIILSSGVYKTWLRIVNRTSHGVDPVRRFATNLAVEIRALRHELLKHPRFGWTAMDREHLRSKGKSDGAIDALLLPRIVQSCENEVLGIIHRSFHRSLWIIRAKVFDGLIIEPHPACIDAALGLKQALADATTACALQGWNVVLLEKPLHGLQDQPLKAITEAREVMRQP